VTARPRWRVRARSAPGDFHAEIDTGGGFRPATAAEIRAALAAASRIHSTGGGTIGHAPVRSAVEPGAVRGAVDATVEGCEVDLVGGYLRERGTDDEIRRRRVAGETIRSIADAVGVGVGTVQRALKRGRSSP